MIYSLWKEGFRATGECAYAEFLGNFEGESLADAAQKYDMTRPERMRRGWPLRINEGVPSIWACRIFDNEMDARRAFG